MARRKNNPGTLVIQETFISEREDGKSYLLGEPTEYYEPFTDNLGRLFKSLRREYGRCTGRVYIDTPDGSTNAIGWVFEKRVEFEDADRVRLTGRDRFYNQQVWITYKYI